MATKEELEQRVKGIETALSAMEDAIRNLASTDNNIMSILSKLSQDVSVLKAEMVQVKQVAAKAADNSKTSSSTYR